jgi:hypothetical protein
MHSSALNRVRRDRSRGHPGASATRISQPNLACHVPPASRRMCWPTPGEAFDSNFWRGKGFEPSLLRDRTGDKNGHRTARTVQFVSSFSVQIRVPRTIGVGLHNCPMRSRKHGRLFYPIFGDQARLKSGDARIKTAMHEILLFSRISTLGVHGVAGFLSIILSGVFAPTAGNSDGTDGLLLGGGAFFWKAMRCYRRARRRQSAGEGP